MFCNSLLISELHHYAEYDHGDDFICETSGSETHFHGDELVISNCWVCTFQFSSQEANDILRVDFSIEISKIQSDFYYEDASIEIVSFHGFLRGPPAFFI